MTFDIDTDAAGCKECIRHCQAHGVAMDDNSMLIQNIPTNVCAINELKCKNFFEIIPEKFWGMIIYENHYLIRKGGKKYIWLILMN